MAIIWGDRSNPAVMYRVAGGLVEKRLKRIIESWSRAGIGSVYYASLPMLQGDVVLIELVIDLNDRSGRMWLTTSVTSLMVANVEVHHLKAFLFSEFAALIRAARASRSLSRPAPGPDAAPA